VYPALAVLKALGDQANPVLWVGSQGGMEADLVQRAHIPFKSIPAAGVHGVSLVSLPGNILQLSRGVLASRRILSQFHPDVILFTGGYVAAPMAVAAGRTPTLLYVPDIEPGLALKFLARYSKCIAVTTEESRGYFSEKAHTVVTGYPTRSDLVEWLGRKTEARILLNVRTDLPVVLAFGGSKGSHSINQAVTSILPNLLESAEVIHITGALDWNDAQTMHDAMPASLAARYHHHQYLHEEMGAALAAADLVVSRAGASILGEYPLFGLPAILIPYPYAWRYQKVNADYLVQRQTAEMLPDENLKEKLLPTILGTLQNPAKLQAMRQAISALARPAAATEIANLAIELAASQPAREGSSHG
jgi:UDP-N-acetylglucosamine--N-acetylmuramyl-(pentapeptide) pyrophosphoryl-undecaprenol N-acetylglucosamine transferase